MGLPDFMKWKCAGCGKTAEGNAKPCDCATGVGYRTGPNGTPEHTVFDADPSAQWDEWYQRLPKDITRKLSLHDFKRLGDLFKEVFNVQ